MRIIYFLQFLLFMFPFVINNAFKNRLFSSKPFSTIQSNKVSLLPRMREFVNDKDLTPDVINHTEKLRILQFNILADGLSGLRNDLGGFSRIKQEFLGWDHRKHLLAEELLQYDPDIITLQECDHFHDYLSPLLSSKGYHGFFLPKPKSKCLEVSNLSDGCAIFVKSNRIQVHEVHNLTYRESHDSFFNQISLILRCNLYSKNQQTNPCFIATTHLKASKTSQGEEQRNSQITQLLDELSRLSRKLPSPPLIILSGDLNSSPDYSNQFKYHPQVYNTIKLHPFGFKSVYNDDYKDIKKKHGENCDVWSTWKARKRNNTEEHIIKHCIDYIFYSTNQKLVCRPIAILENFQEQELSPNFLPNDWYPSDHIALVTDLSLSRP